MKSGSNTELKQLLKQSIPRISTELQHDLWPRTVQRLSDSVWNEGNRASSAPVAPPPSGEGINDNSTLLTKSDAQEKAVGTRSVLRKPLIEHDATDKIRVLAVDSTPMNSQLLLEALAREKRLEMIACPASTSEIVSLARRGRVQIAVIAARVADGTKSGVELAREIRGASPPTRIIMLLDSSERSAVLEAFLAGARGVFSRNDSLKALAMCIYSVHAGQVWASSRELQFVLEALCEPAPMRLLNSKGTAMLSARELEVVQCVAEGLTDREIAKRLGLTEHTVKNYLFRIFDKLGASSRVEVALYALENSRPTRGPDHASEAESLKRGVTGPVIPSKVTSFRVD